MSDERFDKLMKKRLESVRPVYQSHAWDRFRKRLPLVGFWPWLGQYGGWLLSGLMLLGWLFLFYQVHHHQREIRQLSDTLRETAQRNQQLTRLYRTQPALDHSVDTVYIVKRTIIEHQHFYNQTGVAALTAERVQQAKRATSARTSALPILAPTGLGIAAQLASANNRSDSQLASVPVDPPMPKKMLTNQSVALDTLSQKAEPVLAQPQPALPSAKPRQTAFRLSTLTPRVGIEVLLTPSGVGLGPSVEVALNDNLGLSIGLQAAQVHSRTHRSLKEYNTATGKDFINQYQPYLPAQYDRIDDIGVRTAVISLKYYVPLKSNWRLLFQTGTYFDLAAYQQVHYDSDYQGDEQYNTFEANAQRSFFHNFVFGVGMHFHTARISGQLVPSYLYDFRSMANMPAGSSLGLRGSVWINLVK